jgi:trans-aconitate 2-methyltransferase
MPRDGWSPPDHARFRDARRRPFLDLLALVEPGPAGSTRVLDVGCGTGELTHEAHRRLGAVATLGLDASPAMLEQARASEGVAFRCAAVPPGLPPGPFDVILSNSALNWVPGHEALLAALAERLAPGGQLAIQMPFNPDAPFTRCCEAVAGSPAFRDALEGFVHVSPVQPPEFYLEHLDALGFAPVRAGAWLYPQQHLDAGGVADFARGGLLSAYRARLEPAHFEAFVQAYRAALSEALGPGPIRFAFRRVFAWGRRAS